MDLTSLKVIKNLLERYDSRPFKGWGQNFLIDKQVLKKIIDAANLKKSDIVLEIGPGIGTLTHELAKRAKKVISVEKDKKMVEILKETLKDFDNVEVVRGDILKSNIQNLISNTSYKIVANLPYYVVAPVIRKFLECNEVECNEARPRYMPRYMILMVQKEVAQRICSKPPDMNLLAVSVQFYVHPHTKFGVGARPEILFYVSKNSFWPRPKVDGAVIKIIPRESAFKIRVNPLLFFKIVKAGFSHPRKQLCNNLANGLKLNKAQVRNWLLKNGVQPSQRAETLKIKDWLNLTMTY